MNESDRVTGIGGVFFKAQNPRALARWYATHLGVPVEGLSGNEAESDAEANQQQSAIFQWHPMEEPDGVAATVWALFPRATTYFGEQSNALMINYRVKDLDAFLETLRREGVWVDDHREDYEYGRFAWIKDPEGNRIELWQPLGE